MNYARDHFTLRSILLWTLALSTGALLLWYGHFQATALITGPIVVISEDTEILHTSRTTTLSGIAQNVTEITLNDRPISTDEEGRFHEMLVLENGYTIITIRAKDRYGRHIAVTQPFVYTPAYSETQRYQ